MTTFGNAIESAMNEAGDKAKTTAKAQQARERVLNEWLGIKGHQFRDPAGVKSTTVVQADTESSGPVVL